MADADDAIARASPKVRPHGTQSPFSPGSDASCTLVAFEERLQAMHKFQQEVEAMLLIALRERNEQLGEQIDQRRGVRVRDAREGVSGSIRVLALVFAVGGDERRARRSDRRRQRRGGRRVQTLRRRNRWLVAAHPIHAELVVQLKIYTDNINIWLVGWLVGWVG